MQVRLKPTAGNLFPLGGLLIKGQSLTGWVREIQRMQLPISAITVYAIPGDTANSVWGCLVTGTLPDSDLADQHPFCQLVNNKLFIPAYCTVYPSLSATDTDKLFSSSRYILHPEFGLVALTEPVNWADYFEIAPPAAIHIHKPASPVPIPSTIHSFLINPVAPEQALEALEKKMVPSPEKFEDKPLTFFEKLKLAIYRKLFKPRKDRQPGEPSGKGYLLRQLDKLSQRFAGEENKLVSNMEQDYEDLEKRNQQELDKLLELFKNNPDEALKYAVPLNNETSRGNDGSMGSFGFMQRWFSFSLTGNSPGRNGGGNATIASSQYQSLENQYRKTAAELLKKQEYHKAAFVYLKLLKDYTAAAQVLEEGKLYEEAAAIYLQYLDNKEKAAECYEKGLMTLQAIELYASLGKNEKAGDLYMSIHKTKEAHQYYRMDIERYVALHQYIAATRILKPKMNETAEAQALLLAGWKGNYDALNCLNHYFANIEDVQQLKRDLQYLYRHETNLKNQENFLHALKHVYSRQETLSEDIRDIVYEIIAAHAGFNPGIVSELRHFKKDDNMLIKDIMKYRAKKPGKH